MWPAISLCYCSFSTTLWNLSNCSNPDYQQFHLDNYTLASFWRYKAKIKILFFCEPSLWVEVSNDILVPGFHCAYRASRGCNQQIFIRGDRWAVFWGSGRGSANIMYLLPQLFTAVVLLWFDRNAPIGCQDRMDKIHLGMLKTRLQNDNLGGGVVH